jgi:hypothetical protein
MGIRETIYGRNSVCECLLAGRRRIYKLFLARGVKERDLVAEIVALAQKAKVAIERVERATLDRIGARLRWWECMGSSSPNAVPWGSPQPLPTPRLGLQNTSR